MTVTATPSWAEQQAERRRCAEVEERKLQAARRYQEAFVETEAAAKRDGTAKRVGSAAAVTTAATAAWRGVVSSGGQLGASAAGNAVALGAAGAAGRRLSPARRRLPPSAAAAAPACQRTGQVGAPLTLRTLGRPPQLAQPLLLNEVPLPPSPEGAVGTAAAPGSGSAER